MKKSGGGLILDAMITRLSSGGLITNYHCSAACKHCLYKSSPRRDKSYMDEDLLRPMLRKAVSLGCSSFHIGGGEPFLNLPGLYRTLEIMEEEGVALDYLETNASWFKDDQSCRAVLKELARRGCATLMVSVCPFHNEFIPLRKMEGVIEACQETGMGVFIWQEQYYRHLAALERDVTHSFEELEEIWGANYFLKAGKRFGLTMNGRALESYRPYMPHRPAEEIVKDNPGGCGELENTNHFHLDLRGYFIPPGCVGLQIHYADLGSEPDEGAYPHYLALGRGGPGELFELARERGFTPREEGYVSKCDLCGDIRRFLMERGPGNAVRDLGPADYYTADLTASETTAPRTGPGAGA